MELFTTLRERPLINYMTNLERNVLSNVPSRHHPRQIVPVHRVNTALSLLRVRPGYVICPSMARPLVEGFGLVFRPLSQPTVTWRIALFSRNRSLLSPAVESFVDYVREASEAGIENTGPSQR
jgi:DNA-binding transcriptional LysR family regulator